MKIEGRNRISHPAKLVFETLRDKNPELVAFMPNIESCKVLSREEKPPVVHLRSRWQGTNDDVPKLLRPFVSRDLAAWLDKAEWDEKTLVCTWAVESVIAKNVFDCKGTTTISDEGDGTSLFVMDAELHIHTDKVPGVPKFLANKVRAPLEKFIANALSPNLTSISNAVQKYLDAKTG
ncbi:MAG: hypothetical protein V1754_13125 [Pseudomonadota bacterium]